MSKLTIRQLTKKLKEKDKSVELYKSSSTLLRIFIYKQKSKYPITALIDRLRGYEITRISDYPKQESHYPICVVEIKSLRIKKKVMKKIKTKK